MWGKHITGNPPPCAVFNEQDLAILRILGDTPSFRGIRSRTFDTPIMMAAPSNRSQAVVAIQCRATVDNAPSNITTAINTGIINFLHTFTFASVLNPSLKTQVYIPITSFYYRWTKSGSGTNVSKIAERKA